MKSVSQKEKQIKAVPIARITGCARRLVVNSSWVVGCQSRVSYSIIRSLFRNQNPQCAYSNVAIILYFGKGRHFGEGSSKGRSKVPCLKLQIQGYLMKDKMFMISYPFYFLLQLKHKWEWNVYTAKSSSVNMQPGYIKQVTIQCGTFCLSIVHAL